MKKAHHSYPASPPNLVLLYEFYRRNIEPMQTEGGDANDSLHDPGFLIDLFIKLSASRCANAMIGLSEGLRLKLRCRSGGRDDPFVAPKNLIRETGACPLFLCLVLLIQSVVSAPLGRLGSGKTKLYTISLVDRNFGFHRRACPRGFRKVRLR